MGGGGGNVLDFGGVVQGRERAKGNDCAEVWKEKREENEMILRDTRDESRRENKMVLSALKQRDR